MSIKLTKKVVQNMHRRLNQLIKENDYDLQNEVIQKYSKRLDRVIVIFNKKVLKSSQKNEQWPALVRNSNPQ